MPYFLVQVAYTPVSWRNLVLDPQNRSEILTPVIENLGGKIECSYMSFGDYDAIGILSFPDNITAAALSMAVMSGGGVKHVKTIPLVSWEEDIKAMKKAKKATYKPPESNPMIDRG